VANLTKSWIDALMHEAREAQSRSQLKSRVDPAQLAFECHAFVQEANWAYQLFQEQHAFPCARAAIRACLRRAATLAGLRVLAGAKPRAARADKPAS
jgi:hypothetical protein